ncbi:hypothetical protein SAMN05518845_11688 [Variovorax sp. YR750]|nr:hypothetical protein SAMN05518845_11688 [Variovorax sp. YR750]
MKVLPAGVSGDLDSGAVALRAKALRRSFVSRGGISLKRLALRNHDAALHRDTLCLQAPALWTFNRRVGVASVVWFRVRHVRRALLCRRGVWEPLIERSTWCDVESASAWDASHGAEGSKITWTVIFRVGIFILSIPLSLNGRPRAGRHACCGGLQGPAGHRVRRAQGRDGALNFDRRNYWRRRAAGAFQDFLGRFGPLRGCDTRVARSRGPRRGSICWNIRWARDRGDARNRRCRSAEGLQSNHQGCRICGEATGGATERPTRCSECRVARRASLEPSPKLWVLRPGDPCRANASRQGCEPCENGCIRQAQASNGPENRRPFEARTGGHLCRDLVVLIARSETPIPLPQVDMEQDTRAREQRKDTHDFPHPKPSGCPEK